MKTPPQKALDTLYPVAGWASTQSPHLLSRVLSQYPMEGSHLELREAVPALRRTLVGLSDRRVDGFVFQNWRGDHRGEVLRDSAEIGAAA